MTSRAELFPDRYAFATNPHANYDVMPDIVTFAKGMTAGMAICGAVTTREIAEKSRGHAGLPWSGTYPHDPLPAAGRLAEDAAEHDPRIGLAGEVEGGRDPLAVRVEASRVTLRAPLEQGIIDADVEPGQQIGAQRVAEAIRGEAGEQPRLGTSRLARATPHLGGTLEVVADR